MNKTIDIDLDEFHPAVVETSEKIKFLLVRGRDA